MNVVTPKGYKVLDEQHVVNRKTGEISEYTAVAMPCDGSNFQTMEDKKRKRIAQQKRQEQEMKRNRCEETYYFVNRETCFEDVSPAAVTKLIYLSTYMRYDGNCLMLSQRKAMKREDIAGLLGISNRAYYDFWNEVCPVYVTEDENGFLHMCDIFKRGKLCRKAFTPYQQFYDKGVRKLYKAANGKHHKQLGYLFKLLPYISIEFNLVCFNPLETDINSVELMSIADFCNVIGYTAAHIDRLLKVYNEVRFDVNGRQERFCTMIYNGIDKQNAKICINPSILYAGTNSGRVEVTRLYFLD